MSSLVVITGANRGIGLALVEHYCHQGCDVIAVCRVASAELRDTGAEVIEGVDVIDELGITKLCKEMQGKKIDILINNAGHLDAEELGNIKYQNVMQQFMVNAIGPLRVTEALLDNLQAGSKIAMITSRMGSISDNGSGGYYGYRMSKAALNAAGMSLAKDLQARQISVALLHPGFVKTGMVNFSGEISTAEAADRLSQRIAELTPATSGSFWHSNGEILPW